MKPLVSVLAAALLVSVFITTPWTAGARQVDAPWAAPEFTHADASDWINSIPLKLADLKGKVVLVDFWTYGCWNCYRSFPWLKGLEQRLAGDDFVVLGVHTPEFEHEKDRSQVVAKATEFGLRHPVMIDNDFSFWKAMNTRYWPTFYVIDKTGQVRAKYIGEVHDGDRTAQSIERQIGRLLVEQSS